MNPFISKPLRKVQPGGSTEHRPSKILNKNIAKNPQIVNASKNTTARQSLKNPNPSDINPNNNINLISQNQLVNEEEKNEVNTNSFIANTQSERNIEINYPYISEKNPDELIFKSDDEIFAYLKDKIKAGKIENINQKLEVKKNDFTGFTLSKKSNGFSIYEIEVEDNISKINELLKKQKIEINKKQIEFVYTGGPSSTSSTTEDDSNSKIMKRPKVQVANKYRADNKKPDNFMNALKKKINERFEKENAVVKNEKMDEIANLKNKINKYKGDLKKEEQKEIEAIKRPSNRYVLSTLTVDDPNKRRDSLMRGKGNQKESNNINSINSNAENKAKESERRMSKAMNRFKKAFSNKKDNNLNHKNSEKISSLAEMLKEHIIKPLAEIEEEAEMRPRGGSVEVRKVKESEVVQLLEHAPVVQKKKAKKPKAVNFNEQ
jgi:hypothetical protein